MKIRSFVLMIVAVALAACAGPGQPPNAGNLLVGYGVIVGSRVGLAQAYADLNKAYRDGKINTTTYNTLYNEEVDAQNALNGLGAAIATNKPVTQAQVDAATSKFLTDFATLVPVGGIGPPLTQPG